MKKALCLILAIVLVTTSIEITGVTVSASENETAAQVNTDSYYGEQIEEYSEFDLSADAELDLDIDPDVSFNLDIDTDMKGIAADIYSKLTEYYVTYGNVDNFAYLMNYDDSLIFAKADKTKAYMTSDTALNNKITEEIKKIITKYVYGQINIPAHAFIMDNPQLFWLDSFEVELNVQSYHYYDRDEVTGNVVEYYEYKLAGITYIPTLYYENATDDIDDFNTAVDIAVDEITNSLESDADTYTTLKAIHDYLAEKLVYSDSVIRTPATVFLDLDNSGEHASICEGYSKAFKILCDRFNIPCILVNGDSYGISGDSEQHMWNDVYVDGAWYGMDVAWDDQSAGIMYVYFLSGSDTEGFFSGSTFSVDHKEDRDYWGDGYFYVTYPVLAENRHTEIYTSIEEFDINEIDDTIYTGEAIEPEISIEVMGIELIEGEDYNIEYRDNINAGVATAVIIGINKYTGTKNMYFNIQPKSILNENITYKDQEYTGEAIEPLQSITIDGRALVENQDFTVEYKNNVDIGKGTMIITGIGNYTGTKTVNFNITKISLSNITVYGISDQTYTGSAYKPAIKQLVYGGKTLTNGVDYKITYKDNVNAGTAKVVITGIGDYYTGSKTVTFKIAAKSISQTTVSSIADKTYTGSAIKPSPIVKDSKTKTTLKKGKDYTLSYENNIKTGKATITIKGIGNYTGTKTVTFNIVPKKISVKSLTSPKSKTLKLQWKKNSTVTGYQIQYSTSKKFTSAKTVWVKSYKTTKCTISKLKSKKKYYVRIRGYKTIDGKKKYGAWITKNIKVK